MLKLERQLDAQRMQMEDYQKQHVSILNAITEITSKMSLNVQQNANTTATPMYSYPPPPPPVPQRSRPKVATPETFDGDRSNGRTFLTSCQLYFTLRKSEFQDHKEKIRWILSYMKSGS